MIRDVEDLFRTWDFTDPSLIEDVLDFEGDAELVGEGIMLGSGRTVTLIPYPFTVVELKELMYELENEEGGW